MCDGVWLRRLAEVELKRKLESSGMEKTLYTWERPISLAPSSLISLSVLEVITESASGTLPAGEPRPKMGGPPGGPQKDNHHRPRPQRERETYQHVLSFLG